MSKINTLKGLSIGQPFWYDGVKYLTESFPDMKTVVGKNPEPRAGRPSSVKVLFTDIKRSGPMDEADRMHLLNMVISTLAEHTVTIDDFKELTDDYIKVLRFRPDILVKCAAEVTGITEEQVKARNRKDEVVLARDMCFYYLWMKGSTTIAIGKWFSMSPYTVMHGRDNMIGWIDGGDKDIANQYDQFLERVKQELQIERKRYADEFMAAMS